MELEKLKEIVLDKIEDSIENFDERNKVENLLEDISNELNSLNSENKILKEKVSYFLSRFPEFLSQGTEYQKKYHKYDYLDD